MAHTKGEWKADGAFGHYSVSSMESENGDICQVNEHKTFPTFEAMENAKIIAEAGTVANECGLSPRQLLDQRNMLLIELKSARNIIPHLMEGESEETKRGVRPHLEAIKKAIKKATE